MQINYLFTLLSLILFLSGCVSAPRPVTETHQVTLEDDGSYEVLGHRYTPMNEARNFTQEGIASWYGPTFHGQRTANGEIFDMHDLTAAHKTLPLPSYVEVTNPQNNKKVIVRVNDRGPFHGERIIDLSFAAATALDLVGPGTGKVKVRVLSIAEIEKLSGKERYPQLYIQAGAFSNPALADSYIKKIEQAVHIPAFKLQAEKEGVLIFKIRIGPLSDMSQAYSVQQILAKQQLNQGFVLQE